ncbi:hypothetical protein [Mesorhizobium sp. 113-3-9]|uniref:hypothetical protein n=1 Tax=Mesorhizobium sp. 113-3-9 TaxID=2744517 RepID=UPI00192682BB|nr:hypothetical protein [Mesorhizobium sp. 113-3-9]
MAKLPGGIEALKNAVSRLKFWVQLPFVRLGFYLRERSRKNTLFPRRWLTPSKIIGIDIDGIEDDDREKLDRAFLDLLLSRRDYIKERYNKILIINTSLFLFVAANYFGVVSDISIFGISIKNSPGVAEFLLATSSTIGLYSVSMHGNITVIDGTISYLISKIFPKGMENVLKSALLTDYQFGKYFPINSPHIVFTEVHSLFSILSAIGTAIAYVFCAVVVMFINIKMLLSLWEKSSLGIYSQAAIVYVVFCGIIGLMLIILSRMPGPYRDYTSLQRIQIAEQLNPAHAEALREQAYKASVLDRLELERKGFFKPLPPPSRPSQN